MAHIRERQARGNTVYDVCWRSAGTHRSYTTRNLDEALLAKIAIERGDEPQKLIPDETTLGGFWDSWQTRWQQGKRPKTVLTVTQSRKALEPLMTARLSHLTARMVEDTISEVAGRAPRVAQMALSHLKACLRNAQTRDHAVDPRIFGLTPPRYEGREIRFLEWGEVERLASFLHPQVQRIVPVAALTGMRRSELFDLTDDRVDLAAGSVLLRVTKTRKPRTVWLAGPAEQLLREQMLVRAPNPRGLVFPTPDGFRLNSRFERTFRNAVVLAGAPPCCHGVAAPDFELGAYVCSTCARRSAFAEGALAGTTFHSLRHTFAAMMLRRGGNPLEIAEQMGHMSNGRPDPTMIWKVYGHLYSGATRAAVRRLDDVMEGTG